LIKVPKEILS
jgi:tRNA 2-thiocytidine biosynthesis protein TtcA